MNENAQAEAIFTDGTFVDSRDENGLKVQLYSLYDFYVEVFYSQEENKITRFRSFKSLGQLAPYVKLA